MLESARQWWLRAAETGHPVAMKNLAVQAADEGNESQARQWFLRAAEEGNTDAMIQLGMRAKVGGDIASARQWWLQAANHGEILGQQPFKRASVCDLGSHRFLRLPTGVAVGASWGSPDTFSRMSYLTRKAPWIGRWRRSSPVFPPGDRFVVEIWSLNRYRGLAC